MYGRNTAFTLKETNITSQSEVCALINMRHALADEWKRSLGLEHDTLQKLWGAMVKDFHLVSYCILHCKKKKKSAKVLWQSDTDITNQCIKLKNADSQQTA